jgi:hypothetical protein
MWACDCAQDNCLWRKIARNRTWKTAVVWDVRRLRPRWYFRIYLHHHRKFGKMCAAHISIVIYVTDNFTLHFVAVSHELVNLSWRGKCGLLHLVDEVVV